MSSPPSPPPPQPEPATSSASQQTSSQSWTSWILDSYATSVNPYNSSPAAAHPDQDEEQLEGRTSSTSYGQYSSSINHNPIAISISPTDLPTPPTLTPPATFSGYTKTGRGGAGNFLYNNHASNGLSDTHTNGTAATVAIGSTPQHQHHRRQSSLTSRQKAAALIELLPLSNKDSENIHSGSTSPRPPYGVERSSTFPAPFSDAGHTTSPNLGTRSVSYQRKAPPASLTFSASPTIPSHPSFVPRSPMRSVTMPVQTLASNSTSSSTNPATDSSTQPLSSSPSKPTSTKRLGFGRGGVGNYSAASGIVDQTSYMQTREQRAIAARTRVKVEEEVDGILTRPGGAYVGQGREREKDGDGLGIGMG